jgi:hypothetical protein
LNDAQFSPGDSKFDQGVLSTPVGLSGASAPLHAMPADTLSEKADKPVPRCTPQVFGAGEALPGRLDRTGTGASEGAMAMKR